jgi:hypothetical protein
MHEGIPEEAFPWMAAMRTARLIAERAAEQTSGECVYRVRSQHERGNKNDLLERFHFVNPNEELHLLARILHGLLDRFHCRLIY